MGSDQTDPVDVQAGMCFCYSHAIKSGILAWRPISPQIYLGYMGQNKRFSYFSHMYKITF